MFYQFNSKDTAHQKKYFREVTVEGDGACMYRTCWLQLHSLNIPSSLSLLNVQQFREHLCQALKDFTAGNFVHLSQYEAERLKYYTDLILVYIIHKLEDPKPLAELYQQFSQNFKQLLSQGITLMRDDQSTKVCINYEDFSDETQLATTHKHMKIILETYYHNFISLNSMAKELYEYCLEQVKAYQAAISSGHCLEGFSELKASLQNQGLQYLRNYRQHKFKQAIITELRSVVDGYIYQQDRKRDQDRQYIRNFGSQLQQFLARISNEARQKYPNGIVLHSAEDIAIDNQIATEGIPLYIDDMARPGGWGGGVQLSLIHEIYSVSIQIYRVASHKDCSLDAFSAYELDYPNEWPVLNCLYTGCHYNILTDIEQSTFESKMAEITKKRLAAEARSAAERNAFQERMNRLRLERIRLNEQAERTRLDSRLYTPPREASTENPLADRVLHATRQTVGSAELTHPPATHASMERDYVSKENFQLLEDAYISLHARCRALEESMLSIRMQLASAPVPTFSRLPQFTHHRSNRLARPTPERLSALMPAATDKSHLPSLQDEIPSPPPTYISSLDEDVATSDGNRATSTGYLTVSPLLSSDNEDIYSDPDRDHKTPPNKGTQPQ